MNSETITNQNTVSSIINAVFSNSTTSAIAIIVILVALIAAVYFINKIINFFIKLSKKSKTNIKLPGGIELGWEDKEQDTTTQNTSSDSSETNNVADTADAEATKIVESFKYTQIINVTKQCVESTVDFVSSKEDILKDVKRKQIAQASEFIEIVMSDIKAKYSDLIINNHKDDPSFFIGSDENIYKVEHALPRDFKVFVSDGLNSSFDEALFKKNDAQLEEQSYKLSKTAINALREQFKSYDLKDSAEFIKILDNAEQQLKDAISNSLRNGKTLSVNGHEEIKKECERHNAEINRILSNITNKTTNEVFIEGEE